MSAGLGSLEGHRCRGMLERISADGLALDAHSGLSEADFLREGEAVHRELRPSLPDDYAEFLCELGNEGARLTQLVAGGDVRAIALWRVFRTTYAGRRLEIDDLVTADAHRSNGYGRTLLQWIESRAAELGCEIVTLNSAQHRLDAHRFYEREGFESFGTHFSRAVETSSR
jgi:GNAT superfamily N-acetyltransferase